jgi:hypothetical protein
MANHSLTLAGRPTVRDGLVIEYGVDSIIENTPSCELVKRPGCLAWMVIPQAVRMFLFPHILG